MLAKKKKKKKTSHESSSIICNNTDLRENVMNTTLSPVKSE